MKTKFTNTIYCITLLLLNSLLLNAQNCSVLSASSFVVGARNANGAIVGNHTFSITSNIGAIGSGSPSFAFNCHPTTTPYQNPSAVNASVDYAFQNIPTNQLYKAKAGVPFSITLNPSLFNNSYTLISSGYLAPPSAFKGSESFNGPTNRNYSTIASPDGLTFPNIVFSGGTTRGYVILFFSIRGPDAPMRFNLWTYSIVLPIVVEGNYTPITQSNPVPIKGFLNEPAIPQLILHNPPGDGSTVTFKTNEEACRSISTNTANEESNTGNLKVSMGVAGSVGVFVTTEFEFSASISAGVGAGSSVVKSNGQQNCLSILNAISTTAGVAPANEGSVYMGYSSTIAYGTYPVVTISETLPVVVKLDTALIFGLVPGSAVPFYYSKADIINDIQIKQTIADNSTVPKIKQEALNQIKVWRQVLKKDSTNIKNATNKVLSNPFDLKGEGTVVSGHTTLSLTTSDSYDVSHFLDASVGSSFVIKFGGFGVEGGYEFKTKKTFGQSISNTTNKITEVSYELKDDDEGDLFKIKIVEDPTYGTPIFLLDSLNSKTSCPYEGGIQRYKPKLEINNSTSPIVTISNVSLGTSGNFRVKVCNNSNEIRDYGFGFIGESIINDVSITSTAGTGSSPTGTSITKLATITAVPANGCKTSTYDVNISRRNPASAMSYQNIEFVTYSECEPSIKSSIFANIAFAGPQPPTGVAASKSEVCLGTPVTLTSNCPVATTPTWYTVSEGGFPIATGASVVVNPTINTTYYVGCETPDYKRDRVATQLVLVGTPSTVLNLTSNITANTLQIANTTITANNKIFSPASVTYKAGNSLTLNPGFEANSGTNFMAKIGGCSN